MNEPGPTAFAPYDPRSALGRVGIAAVVAVVVSLLLQRALRVTPLLGALGGWNAGGVAWLGLAWHVIGGADAVVTEARAGAEDPGRRAAYVAVLVGSAASLVAATILSRQVKTMPGEGERTLLAAQCFLAVAVAWSVAHTAFTLRYAHLYYRDDHEGVGGVDFAGGARPDYGDFAYFAFTIGMCFQVSDMSVTSSQIRRAVLAHALISFAFNSVLLAFILNLVFGVMG